MARPDPQKAFMAAALVLLVLPFIALVGLRALRMAAFSSTDAPVWLFPVAAVVWMLFALGIVLLLVRHMNRRVR